MERILDEHPELEHDDILASLAFAADRERRVTSLAGYEAFAGSEYFTQNRAEIGNELPRIRSSSTAWFGTP